MESKGLGWRGQFFSVRRPGSKTAFGTKRTHMTVDMAEGIRREYAVGGVSQQQLARRYGVSQPLISKILRGGCYLP
jgi:ribosome-binding protein aMBF1 (putative translation factor)